MMSMLSKKLLLGCQALLGVTVIFPFLLGSSSNAVLLYGTKILHGIKFYGFTAVGRAVKLKPINFYYCATKILSCFDNRKI